MVSCLLFKQMLLPPPCSPSFMLRGGEGDCFSWLMNTDCDPFCLAWAGARALAQPKESLMTSG